MPTDIKWDAQYFKMIITTQCKSGNFAADQGNLHELYFIYTLDMICGECTHSKGT